MTPTPEQMRAMAEPTCSGPFSDARDCPVHGPLMRATAKDRLADALAKIDQLEATIARVRQWAERERTDIHDEWDMGFIRATKDVLDLLTPPAEARETKDGASE